VGLNTLPAAIRPGDIVLKKAPLASRDRGFYRKLFPSLRVIDPARGGAAADT
jgi:hypothetical protein